METNNQEILELSYEEYRKVISLVGPVMDDYLFVFDVKNSRWFISPKAKERFQIEVNETTDFAAVSDTLIYSSDMEVLQRDLMDIARTGRDRHDLNYRWLDKNGDPVWINCRSRFAFGPDGSLSMMLGCVNEVGTRPIGDNVTGLLQLSSLRDWLERQGDSQKAFTKGYLMLLAVDDAEQLRESAGLGAGESIIKQSVGLIQPLLHEGQRLYRVSDSELAVLDLVHDDTREGEELFRELGSTVERAVQSEQYEHFFTFSAGIYPFTHLSLSTYDEIMRRSRFALRAAGERKNAAVTFNARDYERFMADQWLLQTLRQAVNNGCQGFEMYYQPLISFPEEKLFGAESLLRFRGMDGQIVSPGAFIPLLEESGLIIPVGKWIIRQVIRDCKRIRETAPDFTVHINFSFVQVLRSDVLSDLLAALNESGLPRSAVIVELTESGLLEQNRTAEEFCSRLRREGIPLALDDFGTGYSNFRYLVSMEPQTIKIDRSFTVLAAENDDELRVLSAMAQLVHSIGLHLCVEGVENEEELRRIRSIRPDIIQGYYYSRPVPVEDFLTFAEKYK